MDRRQFLKGAAVLGASMAVSTQGIEAVWATGETVAVDGVYGPLLPPDKNGLQLPKGFRSRIVAATGVATPGGNYRWHVAPDGGTCFATPDKGWIYVSNSEVFNGGGGVGALRFDRRGRAVAGYPILTGTSGNCAGGATLWGTWLSCEENGPTGKVYECDPFGKTPAVQRPALGSFNHEAAAMDPKTGVVYLTEDHEEGRLYRFVPARKNDLSEGQLYAGSVVNGQLTWVPTGVDAPDRQATTTKFAGGEGIWVDGDRMFFTTKHNKKVWKVILSTQIINEIYSSDRTPSAALNAVDNVTVHKKSGQIFVAEDGGNMELCLLRERTTGDVEVSPFLRFVGHDESEVTGPAFSPDGRRLYLSSQRGLDGETGITVEITGPFSQRR